MEGIFIEALWAFVLLSLMLVAQQLALSAAIIAAALSAELGV